MYGMGKDRNRSSREIHSVRGLVGAGLGGLAGGVLGGLGGEHALTVSDRRAAKRLAEASASRKALNATSSIANKAGRAAAKGAMGAGITGVALMAAGGGMIPLTLAITGAPLAGAGVIGAGLAGIPLVAGGFAAHDRLTAAKDMKKAKFLRRGGRLGAAAGALAGAAMLARGKKKLEKKSSVDLGNNFMRGFASELAGLP